MCWLTKIQNISKYNNITKHRSITMFSNNLIGAFIQFFNILGHNVQEQQQLYTGIRIAQFLLTIPQMELPYADIIKDKEIRGACLNNMKIISQALERYHRNVLGIKNYQVEFNVYEIYTEYNQQQLIKLLKECFMLITKAPNYSYYIQKILLLDEPIQVLFAQLIRQDKSYLISPIREHIQRSFEENSSNTSRDHNGEKHKQRQNKCKYEENHQALDLIDKLYECEFQNEKLLNQHKKSLIELGTFKQQIQQLSIQVQTLKQHNQNLKKDLYQHHEQINKLKTTRIDKDREYNKSKQCRKQLQKNIAQCRQQIEMMKIQSDVAKCKYQNHLVELQTQLSRERENSMRLREQIQFYQAELEKIISKYQQYQQQIKQTTKIMKVLEQENKTLHQNQTTLKFEISYKNQQISQFKQLLANLHNSGRRHSYDVDKDDYDYDSRSSVNSKMLASEFAFANTGSTPNLRACFKTDVDEVRALKNQLRDLQKQYDKCKAYKSKVRELEYEKNKLVKILHQFQTSRGEQNQIMTGCLYELQLKLAHNKISFSRSTLGEDITNQIR